MAQEAVVEEDFEVDAETAERLRQASLKREATRRSKAAEQRKQLGADKGLKAQFDKISKGMTNGAPKRVRAPQDPKRKHGRPKGGCVTFDKKRIETIPEVGCMSDVAAALGLKLPSVQQWVELPNDPLPTVMKDGRRILRRDVILKWLVATKRYKPKG